MLFILDTDPLKVERIAESIDIPVVLLKMTDSMPTLMKTALKIKQKSIKKNKLIFYRDFIDETVLDVRDYCSGNGDDTAIIVYTSGTTGDPRASFDNVKADYKNSFLIAPIWIDRSDDIKHDFLIYMKENWNK